MTPIPVLVPALQILSLRASATFTANPFLLPMRGGRVSASTPGRALATTQIRGIKPKRAA
jgi:hypothetical protein